MRQRPLTARLPLILAFCAAVLPAGLAMPARAQQASPAAGVPVTVDKVTKRDVPVLARGIGTVQPLATVVIRARVDGTLDNVSFTEGQTVRQGDLLATIDARPYQALLDQALAKRMADEAQLANARSDLVRYTDLAQSQAASRQRYDQVHAQVLQLEAQVKGDEAAIAQAGLNVSFTRITAPMSGRVGLRMMDPGNLIRAADTAGSGIVTLSQIRPIAVVFTLPQDQLPQIHAAMLRGAALVTAWSSDDKTKLGDGVLLTLDNAIDAGTGTIRLKAEFPNAEEKLWPGQFVNARLQLGMLKGAITVPSMAINRGPSGLFAFVVKPDGTVSLSPVEVAQDDGRTAVVSQGLDEGSQVVVAGQSRLTSGTKVAVSETKPASGT